LKGQMAGSWGDLIVRQYSADCTIRISLGPVHLIDRLFSLLLVASKRQILLRKLASSFSNDSFSARRLRSNQQAVSSITANLLFQLVNLAKVPCVGDFEVVSLILDLEHSIPKLHDFIPDIQTVAAG
jgi:hypothetical protein